jgi:glutamine transport system permease protein
MESEIPPLRPRIEQIGEKVAAVLIIVLIIGGLLFLLNNSSPIDLAYILKEFPSLLSPASLTLLMTVGSYLVGMGIGFFLGWVRTLKFLPFRALATGWVESIRGTPFLVQLYVLFAIFSFYNPGNLSSFDRLRVTGFLAMMINTGAYQAEIFRAGLQSVPVGQVEAAKSVGLGYWGAMRTVILPQAVRVVIPPLTNEFILMLKASALLSVIGVHELTDAARVLSFGGKFVEVYLMVTVLYLLMTVPIAKAVAWLERRYRIPGLGMQQEARARPIGGSRAVVQRLSGIDISAFRAHDAARGLGSSCDSPTGSWRREEA